MDSLFNDRCCASYLPARSIRRDLIGDSEHGYDIVSVLSHLADYLTKLNPPKELRWFDLEDWPTIDSDEAHGN